MIVKNEAHVIERLLESVIDWIDCYVICDTGSTDDTVARILRALDGKRGLVFHEPFLNFSHNRNIALERCRDMPAEYLLLLDADMVFEPGPLFSKESLTGADYFVVSQGNDQFRFQNTRVVRNKPGFQYHGSTHEYIAAPDHATRAVLPPDLVFIRDVGDGGSKTYKFSRDICLLRADLKERPHDARALFYLANSYKNTRNWKAAIEAYRKRISEGGWVEEVFISFLEMGRCYQQLEQDTRAVAAWLDGAQVHPRRIETLFAAVQLFRAKGKYHLAAGFHDWARRVLADNAAAGVDPEEFLFFERDVYTYKLDFEQILFSFYVGRADIPGAVYSVLARGLPVEVDNALQNAKFYKYVPPARRTAVLDARLGSYYSSSCSLISFEDGYLANQRFVNYYIQEDGSYVCASTISTINKTLFLDDSFRVQGEHVFINKEEPRGAANYVGVEDVKLFRHMDRVYFLGTQCRRDGRLGMVGGFYDIGAEQLQGNDLAPAWNPDFQCEKNWVFVSDDDDLMIIYRWHPLTLCSTRGETRLHVTRQVPTPRVLERARGSTCGSKCGGEWYFVVHFVSHETPRHYYHAVVVLGHDMGFRRMSRLFSFEGCPIEFCLGLVARPQKLLMSYSTWDRTTRIVEYEMSVLFNGS